MSTNIDDSSFLKGLENFGKKAWDAIGKAIFEVATEALRLSQNEVPLDKGPLKNSGMVEPGLEEFEQIVGYNKIYAARLHEHPEFRFRRDRNPNAKGKYLEDPVKQNLPIFKSHVTESYNNAIGI